MQWAVDLAAEVSPEISTSMFERLLAPGVAALAVIVAGAFTLIGTFRTSGRAAQTQRDAQLDERADKQYDKAQAENARLIALLDQREKERDEARSTMTDYRERYAQLRLRVMAAGFDPDTIGQEKGVL